MGSLVTTTKLPVFILHQSLRVHLRMLNINHALSNSSAKSSLGRAKRVLAFILQGHVSLIFVSIAKEPIELLRSI